MTSRTCMVRKERIWTQTCTTTRTTTSSQTATHQSTRPSCTRRAITESDKSQIIKQAWLAIIPLSQSMILLGKVSIDHHLSGRTKWSDRRSQTRWIRPSWACTTRTRLRELRQITASILKFRIRVKISIRSCREPALVRLISVPRGILKAWVFWDNRSQDLVKLDYTRWIVNKNCKHWIKLAATITQTQQILA